MSYVPALFDNVQRREPSPSFTEDSGIYRLPRYAIHRGEVGVHHAERPQKPDMLHVSGAEPSHRVHFAHDCETSMPTLTVSVGIVVGNGPEKQMANPYAFPIVAGVEHAKIPRNRPMLSNPCETVGQYGAIERFWASHAPVAVTYGGRPFQTVPISPHSRIEFSPEARAKSFYRYKLAVSHGEPPIKVPAVRLGETLARLPGRSYFTRGAA